MSTSSRETGTSRVSQAPRTATPGTSVSSGVVQGGDLGILSSEGEEEEEEEYEEEENEEEEGGEEEGVLQEVNVEEEEEYYEEDEHGDEEFYSDDYDIPKQPAKSKEEEEEEEEDFAPMLPPSLSSPTTRSPHPISTSTTTTIRATPKSTGHNLTHPTTFLPHHWSLLESLFYSTAPSSGTITPPKCHARWSLYGAMRHYEIPAQAWDLNDARADTGEAVPEPLLRVPVLGWNVHHPKNWAKVTRGLIETRIRQREMERHHPYRRRKARGAGGDRDGYRKEWRQDKVFELDERERRVVRMFREEARRRFGEEWSEAKVLGGVVAWGVARVRSGLREGSRREG
ncbi:hypothetical protein BDZ91DRAFT_743139 [Kalaharituber pfeilii]|nr:hypothetical protein BDZ91DRAFT_743139 [Kalaharituber pfeilii]